MKRIVDYTEDEIKEMICAGVSQPQALRDYEACKLTLQGKSTSQIAFELNIGTATVTKARRLLRVSSRAKKA
jgi:DNA-binding CsgD family transcriptional regulator